MLLSGILDAEESGFMLEIIELDNQWFEQHLSNYA